mmetsp:Transcript_22578/g.55671  ORF Transcript_22578/g.55671 Transcript_22578/m.55671 type:complete len:514 (+) Transcript_22578:83-1624(+)
MADRDDDSYKVEVLKNALKSAAEHREAELQDLWKRAERDRKLLLSQVSELKTELVRRGSPKNILNDVTSKLTEIKNTVTTSVKDGSFTAGADGGLWAVDDDMSEASSSRRGSTQNAADSESSAAGPTRYKIRTLEAKVAAQDDENRELRAMLSERDATVAKLQQRNGTLSAKLEEREQQMQALEARIARLHKRLHQSDAYAPPGWMSSSSVRDQHSLEALAHLQGATGATAWHEDDLGHVGLVPGFDEFEDRLKQKEAEPLVGMIESFVQALQLKCPKLSDHSMVHNFLGAMENPFRTNKLWKDCEESDLEDAMDALEKRILSDSRVYSSIMANMGQSWEMMDANFERRRFCLQFLQSGHLDIKRSHAMHPAITLSRKMLDRVQEVKAPQEKLECIFRSARLVFRMLNEAAAISNSEAASADDFLPIFIYVVLRSNVPRVYSTIEYISLFRRPSRLSGERHYYLVQFQTAVTFIDNLDHRSLTIDGDEFASSYSKREELWQSREGDGGAGSLS